MGLCIDCIYHRNASELDQKFYTKPFGECGHKVQLTHICSHPDHIIKNYITGEERYESCYKWNGYNECLLFDDGKEEPDEPTEPTDPVDPNEPTNDPAGYSNEEDGD